MSVANTRTISQWISMQYRGATGFLRDILALIERDMLVPDLGNRCAIPFAMSDVVHSGEPQPAVLFNTRRNLIALKDEQLDISPFAVSLRRRITAKGLKDRLAVYAGLVSDDEY